MFTLNTAYFDGILQPSEIAEKTIEQGGKHLCITDHGAITCHHEQMKVAKEYGLIPIFGSELYHHSKWHPNRKNSFHLVVLAKNQEGLQNLWALSNAMYEEADKTGHKKPLATDELLKKYGEGLIATTACLRGGIPRYFLGDPDGLGANAIDLLNMYQQWFDEVYVELQTNQQEDQKRVNYQLVEFAKENGLKTIYTCDAHYLKPEDAPFQQAFMGLSMRKKQSDPQPYDTSPYYYMLDENEIRKSLKYLGEEAINDAFDGIDNLVSSIQSDIEFDTSRKLPSISTNAAIDLRKLCLEGMKIKIYDRGIIKETDEDPDRYWKRLKEELDMIHAGELEDYFLLMADTIKWAKKNNIWIAPGRGSSGGSLVCYLTDITEIDPIPYDLLFSRFLDLARLGLNERGEKVGIAELPDVDTDIADDKRYLIQEYLENKYGSENVAGIGTFQNYGIKAAFKDACYWYDIDFQYANRLSKILAAGNIDAYNSLKEAMPHMGSGFNNFAKQHPEVITLSDRITGLPRQLGTHAAGFVVSSVPLAGKIPTKVRDGVVSTQFAKKEVEALGFLKLDLLGLRTLTTLAKFADIMDEQHPNGEWRNHKKALNFFYDLDDKSPGAKQAFDMIQNGQTLGTFQMETPGITGVVKKMQAHCIDDISTAVALYRPGVLGAGMLDVYLKNRSGETPIEQIHPIYDKVAAETHGVLVFQESAMRICREMAGYSDIEANHFRKICAQKEQEKVDAERPKFVQGCKDAHNVPEEISNRIFDMMRAAGAYSFNKAHSAEYAIIGFWTAWAKANYKTEWLTACLTTMPFDRAAGIIDDGKALGAVFKNPSVNYSQREFTIHNDEILFGLQGIKFVGDIAIQEVIDNAPYESFEDLIAKTSTKVNKRVLEYLIKAGALDEFGERNELLGKKDAIKKKKDIRIVSEYAPTEFSDYELQSFEKEALGIVISFDKWKQVPDVMKVDFVADEMPDRTYVKAALEITSVRFDLKQDNGKPYTRGKAKTHKGKNVDFKVFGDNHFNFMPLLEGKEGHIVLFNLRKNEFNNRHEFIVEDVRYIKNVS